MMSQMTLCLILVFLAVLVIPEIHGFRILIIHVRNVLILLPSSNV